MIGDWNVWQTADIHKPTSNEPIFHIEEACRLAHAASRAMGVVASDIKDRALDAMAVSLMARSDEILQANEKDVLAATAQGVSKAFLDRLALNPSRIKALAESVRALVQFPDPIGELMGGWCRPNGLQIQKVRVPLGVLAIIYEARPNVTADAIALAIKSGNSVVLRGSSSSIHSNEAIAAVMISAAEKAGIPAGAIQLIRDTTREGVDTLIKMNQFLDVVIPRGGASLIQSVLKNATVPVIETGEGNCHIYVDKGADVAKAVSVILNAKTHRPSTCNSAEKVLIHEGIAQAILPPLVTALRSAGVDVRGCEKSKAIVSEIHKASTEDWREEYLDLVIAVKVVPTIDAAIQHIHEYGTSHTEAILSNDFNAIQTFTRNVDAAVVVVNASTRFTDGGEFGFGTEMGISTQKLHARGPMGLEALTTHKFIVVGDGHVRK